MDSFHSRGIYRPGVLYGEFPEAQRKFEDLFNGAKNRRTGRPSEVERRLEKLQVGGWWGPWWLVENSNFFF